MALTVNSVVNGMMSNPEVVAVSMAIGFVLAKALGMRNRGMGGMGGGF